MNDFPKELFLRPRTAKILAVGRADKEIKCFQIFFCPCKNILFIRYSCTNSYVGCTHMIIFLSVLLHVRL